MANTTISPNMNMPVPVVSTDPGPDWATNVNSCLSIIDSHNHSSGQGVQITPSGLNINSDLSFLSNNATTLRSMRFTPQNGVLSGAADLGCLYENGVDLYYNDGAGNNVRITQSGSVSGSTGTITGLPSGSASASFAGSTFTFQSATNTPATVNVGPVVLGQAVASGKNVTISASGSQPANYNLTLPTALPASVQSAPVSDTSGNLSFFQLQSGTYSPTVVTNGSGSGQAALGPFFYTRIGNIVTVSGSVTGTPDAITFTLGWLISVPINPTSTFSHVYDIAGAMNVTIVTGNPPVQNDFAANTGSNQLGITVRYTSITGSKTLPVIFMYSCA